MLARVPDLQYIQVKYFVLGDVHRSRVSIVQVDRHWFSMCVRTRDDHTGFWLARTCADPPPQPEPTVSEATFPKSSSQFATDIAQSLVTVEFHTPVMVDGVHSSTFVGIGVVVDAEKGLVVVDRNTAAISLGDIIVTVASSIELAGRLVYQHVVHNFAVIQYDPALLGSTPVKTAKLSSKRLVVVRAAVCCHAVCYRGMPMYVCATPLWCADLPTCGAVPLAAMRRATAANS